MPIQFECLKCGKRLKAPDHAAGKTSKCPQCGSPVTCPEPIYEAEAVEQPEAPEIIDDELDPYADVGSPDPYALAGEPEPATTAERRRPCPMCGEMILADAVKCRFCGEVFDATLKKAETKKKRKKKRSYDASEEDLTTGEVLIGIFCAGIGCIMGLIWMIQGKPKGGKLLAISIASNIVWGIIRFLIESGLQQGQGPP
jgi:hypothetical protein